MMAYDSSFVLAILHGGSPVREINGKVTLPFSSEYKIRLKNKSNLRAKACVTIDGRKVSNLGDFILHPNETLDLERFLDDSMHSGNRFKFVPLSDRRVNDPTDSNNGIIKVKFYKEQAFKPDWKPNPITPGPYYYGGRTGTGDANFLKSTTTCSNTYSSISSTNFVCDSNTISLNAVSSPNQAGATVEGGHSSQSFVEGDDFLTDAFPVTITLKLQGPFIRTQKHTHTPKPAVKFCGECGSRRQRKDNFCRRCGRQFPAKRRQ